MDILDFIFAQTLTKIIFILIVALIVQFIVRFTVDKVVRRLIRRHKYQTVLDEKKREKTLSSIFKTLSTVIVWLVAVLSILTVLRVDLAALITGAGLVGVVVGFGAQNTIKDILAGIFIITENQYRVGDIVTLHAAGQPVSGEVEDITVRITRLRDLDGNVHIVKNGSAEVITNLSLYYANVNINIDVTFDADIDEVEKVINKIGADMIAENAPLKEHIYEPIKFLRVDGFEPSGVRVKALGKVEPAMQWEVSGAFLRLINVAFKKHGIEMPLTQVVVHTAPKAKS